MQLSIEEFKEMLSDKDMPLEFVADAVGEAGFHEIEENLRGVSFLSGMTNRKWWILIVNRAGFSVYDHPEQTQRAIAEFKEWYALQYGTEGSFVGYRSRRKVK